MLKLAQVNAMSGPDFTRVLGSVFEHSPWVAERSSAKRPFATRDQLHAAMCGIVHASRNDEKLALIRAHPDLVGRAVLTSESETEQASAGLQNLTAEDVARFDKCNRAYKERFGFPFVICARLNKKNAILDAFPQRLVNSRAQEMRAALEEIFKIAELRLRDIIAE